MGDNTKIEWADATINFWHGCKKVSQGCKYCYMFRDKVRYGQDGTNVQRSKNETFFRALKWKEPRRIFTCSWSDFFIKEADEWRAEAWKVIKDTPQHQWLILTKRPERILQCLPKDWGDKGYENVWLGVSVENQKTADNRILKLFEVPCKIRFLSVEPLLAPINLNPYLALEIDHKIIYPIHWVIIGGESGNDTGEFKYRVCKTDWMKDIVKQCSDREIPIFMKQLGTSIAKQLELKDRVGADLSEEKFPAYLAIRQLPAILENE
jgi:protein gp37